MRIVRIGLCLAGVALGCASAWADDALPPNYRQLIVQTIWGRGDPQSIRSARISQPTEVWMGILAGGNRRVICVEVFRKTLITDAARDVWVFAFKDGRVAQAVYMDAKCDGYEPFNELVKKK